MNSKHPTPPVITRRAFLRASAATAILPFVWDVPAAATGAVLIRGGRLIDGRGGPPLENASILIENGRFKSIRAGALTAPAGATVVDAAGKTVLPGLVDMHAHLLSGGFDTISEKSMSYDPAEQARALRQMLYWGVTTVYSPVQPLATVLELRAATARSAASMPRLFVSGPGFTAPGGWAGSTDPAARFEPKTAAEAREQVALAARAGIDIFKVFFDDMSHAFVTPLPKLDRALMTAIIAAAHARKRKVMVHAYETANHKAAMRAGAEIMAHSAVTEPIDAEYLDLAAKSRTLYLGTLSVYNDVFDANAIRELAALEAIRTSVPKKTLATLTEGPVLEAFEGSIKGDYFKRQLPTIMANMKRAFEAGIAVGVGPDTGVPGAFPGFAVHREMELMVKAGIPPADVLVAATRTGARYLDQPSLGTIERGKVADAVVVAGNPLTDIASTRRVEAVVQGGAVVDRGRLLDEIMAAR